MYPKEPFSLALTTRRAVVVSMLALCVLSGCAERVYPAGATNAVPPAQSSLLAEPVSDDLARFGRTVAVRSASLKLEFLGVRKGIDSAGVDPDEGSDWSVFFLSFAATQPSALQMTGNPQSQTRSPENQLRHERWHAQVCTPELRAIMREHGIDVVYATFGSADMPMADCRQTGN